MRHWVTVRSAGKENFSIYAWKRRTYSFFFSEKCPRWNRWGDVILIMFWSYFGNVFFYSYFIFENKFLSEKKKKIIESNFGLKNVLISILGTTQPISKLYIHIHKHIIIDDLLELIEQQLGRGDRTSLQGCMFNYHGSEHDAFLLL